MPKATGIPEDSSLNDNMKEQLANLRRMWAAQKTLGERFDVPREGKAAVSTILYRPGAHRGESRKLPVLFNMHGGGWIGGDAVLMESFCQMMADMLPAMVVNINYTKADVQPMPYQQEEIVDAVRYFASNNEKYGIDPAKFAVGGHSAGAHLACCAAYMLAQEQFGLAAQMLVYPVADLTKESDMMKTISHILFPHGGRESHIISPATAPLEKLEKLAPAVFVVCGKDDLLSEGLEYAARLVDAGVEVKVKKYLHAEHGFLEVNRPDYPDGDARKNPEQERYARDCEAYLVRELKNLLS